MANDSTILPSVDDPPGQAPVSGNNTGVAFDYSQHLDRLVSALDQIAISAAGINDKLGTIVADSNLIAIAQTSIMSSQTTIAAKQSAMETYQKKVKELAEGTGVHFVGPWEWVGLLSLYKLFIEEGKILEETNNVSAEKLAEALAKFNQYKDKVNSLPTVF